MINFCNLNMYCTNPNAYTIYSIPFVQQKNKLTNIDAYQFSNLPIYNSSPAPHSIQTNQIYA